MRREKVSETSTRMVKKKLESFVYVRGAVYNFAETPTNTEGKIFYRFNDINV